MIEYTLLNFENFGQPSGEKLNYMYYIENKSDIFAPRKDSNSQNFSILKLIS
jgi:hypothetical protein